MAEIDVYFRDIIWKYLVIFSCLAVIVIIYLTDSARDVRKRFFQWVMEDFGAIQDELTEDMKQALFEDIKDVESRVVDLRNKGLIRILEIGVGSGTNLKYYPQQCRLVLVDPNSYFKQYFEENRDKFPDINLEKFIISSGENMRTVASKTVDVVVTTTVLCSVDKIDRVLKEILRVLVPGGKYYLLEHVIDKPSTRRFKLQHFLNQTGIWPSLFDGCQFHNIRSEISKAGFSHFDYKEFDLESDEVQGKSKLMMDIMAPHIVGVAIK